MMCYDTVFIDLNMPNISGLDVIRRAKKLECKTRIIPMSGFFSMNQEEFQKLKAETYATLDKPFQREVLEYILEEYKEAA